MVGVSGWLNDQLTEVGLDESRRGPGPGSRRRPRAIPIRRKRRAFIANQERRIGDLPRCGSGFDRTDAQRVEVLGGRGRGFLEGA